MACQLKISLVGSDPLIWRRILIRPNINFLDLHLIIQGAMGWENSHMFAFSHPEKKRLKIGLIYEEDYMEENLLDANEVLVQNELTPENPVIIYEYDFGDSWTHRIELEAITEDKILPKAICFEGGSACPPEDCGGILGYYQLVKSINNPKSDEDRQRVQWMGIATGEKWDVNKFDVDEMNTGIQTYLNDPYYF